MIHARVEVGKNINSAVEENKNGRKRLLTVCILHQTLRCNIYTVNVISY